MSLWVYLDSLAFQPFFVLKLGNGTQEVYKVGIGGGNKLDFRVNDDDLLSTTSIGSGEWIHIVTTYDGVEKKIYINGQHIISEPQTGNINTGTGDLYLGADYDGGTNYNQFLDGIMDEVKLFNYALTEEDVLREYNLNSSLRFE